MPKPVQATQLQPLPINTPDMQNALLSGFGFAFKLGMPFIVLVLAFKIATRILFKATDKITDAVTERILRK